MDLPLVKESSTPSKIPKRTSKVPNNSTDKDIIKGKSPIIRLSPISIENNKGEANVKDLTLSPTDKTTNTQILESSLTSDSTSIYITQDKASITSTPNKHDAVIENTSIRQVQDNDCELPIQPMEDTLETQESVEFIQIKNIIDGLNKWSSEETSNKHKRLTNKDQQHLKDELNQILSYAMTMGMTIKNLQSKDKDATIPYILTTPLRMVDNLNTSTELFKDVIPETTKDKTQNKTYAEALKSNKDDYATVIDFNNDSSQHQMRNSIKDIIRSNNIKAKEIRISNINNRIIVKHDSKNDAEQLLKEISTNKYEDLNIKTKIAPPIMNKIMLIGLPMNLKEDDFKKDLYMQTRIDVEKVKIIRKIQTRNEQENYTLEVPNDIYHTLMNYNHIIVDYNRVTIRKFVKIIRCYKCQNFGHTAQICKNQQNFCVKCGMKHSVEECQAQVENCINCREKHYPNHAHRADSNTCRVFREYRNKLFRNSRKNEKDQY